MFVVLLLSVAMISATDASDGSFMIPPPSISRYPPMNLVKLTEYVGAQCLDGTPGAYYLRTVPGSTDWMFYFEGGGWCYSETDCLMRSRTNLGTSKAYPPTMGDGGGGLISPNPATNYFSTYNLVYMKYCDGNSFSGDLAAPVLVNGTLLYFRGKAIREAVLANVLATNPAIANASRVVLTGCSAGGLSTYLHSDTVGAWVAANLKSVKSFVAIPISGFFLLETNVIDQPIYPTQMKAIFELSNAAGGLNSRCVAAMSDDETWKCNFAEFSYAYSAVRTFALNSEMDSWQGICILTSMTVVDQTHNGNCSAAAGWTTCGGNLDKCPAGNSYQPVLDFQEKFRNRVYANAGMVRDGNGGYFSSCFTHCEGQSDGPWTTWRVGGKAMGEAVKDWYLGDPMAPAATNTYRDCTLSTGMPHQCDATCA